MTRYYDVDDITSGRRELKKIIKKKGKNLISAPTRPNFLVIIL